MNDKFHKSIEEQAKLHQLLSNPSRLLILCSLAEKEMSVGELAEVIGASMQNTSQHLRLMRDKGVLITRRDGQTIYYQIAMNEMGAKCKQMLTCLEHKNQLIYLEA